MQNYDYATAIWERTDLTSTETLVALAMLSFRNNETGLCFPSHAAIAERAKLSRPKVSAVIQSLRKKGLVTGACGKGTRARYEFKVVIVGDKSCNRRLHPLKQLRTDKGKERRKRFASMTPAERKAHEFDRRQAEMDKKVFTLPCWNKAAGEEED